jgi:acetylornithine/succinyldiaminopimelate/putrescine aminotransferase
MATVRIRTQTKHFDTFAKKITMLSNKQLFQLHMGLPAIVKDPIEIVRAKGIYLYDIDGNAYTDLVSGVSVSNIGHLHPHVVQAVKEQAETYMHLMVYGKFVQSPQVKLAEKLAQQLPPSLDAVYFVNSGSEAIEGALKLAKRLTHRTEIVAFDKAYHGGTAGALSLLGNEKLKNAFRPLLPDTRTLTFNSFEDIEQITAHTACVVVEPIQAEAGIILPADGWLEALSKKCKETGSLLIFDEIQMGFGRTGKLFAFQHHNVVPDILCMAKAMGGGMPIGAFVSAKEKMLALTNNPELGHITTFGGHPVCCAAALANLEVILDENLAKQADEKGRQFADALVVFPQVKAIRQVGLMLGVELHQEAMLDKLMVNLARERLIVDRFLFNPIAFRIAPPLNITSLEIEETIDRLKNAFEGLQ